MNDFSECLLGHGLFREVLSSVKQRDDQFSSPNRRKIYDLLEQCLGIEIPYNIYCSCFSANGDQLSQWHGYADQGRGVSLGINLERLTGLFHLDDVLGMWVIYQADKQKRYATSLLVNLVSELTKFSDKHGIDAVIVSRSWIERYLVLFALAIKHEGFSEEQEFRLVKIGTHSAHHRGYRLRGAALIPYANLYSPNRFPLETVTLGPGLSNRLHMHAISQFLSDNLHQAESEPARSAVRIEHSIIPFQN